MSNAYSFVLIDTTKTIPAAQLQAIADACTWQAETDVSAEWGATATMRTDTDVNNVKPGESAFVVKQTLPEAPDAVGYHATLPNGMPVAYFAMADCSSVSTGEGSLSQCVSHEMCETLGDPGANRFALKADGQTLQAQELCDRVQDGTYQAPNGVALSNFLLQSAFDPGAPGPWDKLGSLTSAEGRTAGGYEIDATITNETQAQGAAKTATTAAAPAAAAPTTAPAAAKLTITVLGAENMRNHSKHWSSRKSIRERKAA